jgi:hypothetical protein
VSANAGRRVNLKVAEDLLRGYSYLRKLVQPLGVVNAGLRLCIHWGSLARQRRSYCLSDCQTRRGPPGQHAYHRMRPFLRGSLQPFQQSSLNLCDLLTDDVQPGQIAAQFRYRVRAGPPGHAVP